VETEAAKGEALVQGLEFDLDLIRKYDISGPRYTSYPTVLQFSESYTEEDYARVAQASNAARQPLSLYLHLPFCATLCYYCACNKIATRKREWAEPYLEHLIREMHMQGALFDGEREVVQLHWGGGTPTFISDEQMRALMAATGEVFKLCEGDRGEYGIEIDPREVRESTMATLRELGFNRVSLGVQDFEPAVQKAVNRVQPEGMTRAVVQEARRLGFGSVSFDLIYGLPFQTLESFSRTVDTVIDMSPDRLSVFNYAHLPHAFASQKRLDPNDMPTPQEKLAILKMTVDKLTEADYAFIGMDHFAKKTDELYLAQQNGTLHRNFQGYSTHSEADLIGLGVSAIGKITESFYQNEKELDAYYAAIDAGRLPIAKGLDVEPEDRIRRRAILDLICHFRVSFSDFEKATGVRFTEHFAPEMERLHEQAQDGLVEIDDEGIRVTGKGRLLVRHVCLVFDRYSKPRTDTQPRYSRII
jgi:oxygen-independent coproporphyrinogen-3 oxidase